MSNKSTVDIQSKFQEELFETQKSMDFPNDKLFNGFNDFKKLALEKFAPSSLKINIEKWVALYEKEGDYNFSEMGLLLSIMENRSMDSLSISFDDYVQYQTNVHDTSTYYAARINPKIKHLQKKYSAMQYLSLQK